MKLPNRSIAVASLVTAGALKMYDFARHLQDPTIKLSKAADDLRPLCTLENAARKTLNRSVKD